MNVKVKMPRFGRLKKKGSSWIKELLMSVVGTTISIVLTFGTAHLIEQHQRKAEGRDVAMMLIHDIDLYAESFRDFAEQEAQNHELAMYAMEHIDSIENIPFDTIYAVINYLYSSEGYEFRVDDSIEKTFQSNQEIWRSIDAPSFIDQAREFFNNRRMTFQVLNTSPFFRKPVNEEESITIYADAINTGKSIDWYDFLRKKLQDEDVQLYIHLHDQRQTAINATADSYQDMSNRCKFIMNITDEELQAFLDKRKRTGEKLTDKKLVGKWATQDDEQTAFEFNSDHTFKQVIEKHIPSQAYHGRLKLTYTYTGSWKIKNDSLYRYFDAGCDFKFDRSSITFAPKKRDDVEKFMKQLEASAIDQKQKQGRDTIVRAAVIDRSGNKVELTFPENIQNGSNSYLIREK